MLGPTERVHPRARHLEQRTTLEVLERLHAEDFVAVRALDAVLPKLAKLAEAIACALRAGGRLVYVGAGTSGRLAALDAAECPPTFGTKPSQILAVMAGGKRALTRAAEGAEDDSGAGARAMQKLRVSSRDVVVGISASGTTPFVLGALAEARRRKATQALLTGNPKARTTPRIVLDTGAELIAGSTRLKAGTATKLALNALTTAAMVKLGHTRDGRMINLRATNLKLSARAVRLVVELGGVTPAKARVLLERSHQNVRAAVERALR